MIWESLAYVCAEPLTSALVATAEQIARHGELTVTEVVLEQVGRISVSSVQRRLTRLGQDTMRLPRRGPERANTVAKTIPMKRIPWARPSPRTSRSIWCTTVARAAAGSSCISSR